MQFHVPREAGSEAVGGPHHVKGSERTHHVGDPVRDGVDVPAILTDHCSFFYVNLGKIGYEDMRNSSMRV